MTSNDVLGPYERFLELPVAVVLAPLWLVEAELEFSGVAVLYFTVTALLYAVARVKKGHQGYAEVM